MDAQQILDMFLNSGNELVNKGKALAEEQLKIPANEGDRQTMLDGAGKGAMAAGALALLLGTSVGRKLTGAGFKLGSLAAVGGVAYNAFQKWQSQQAAPVANAGQPLTELSGAASDQRGKVLLTAMIAAAKADGTVDDQEKAMITQQLEKLNMGDAANQLLAELNKPLDIKAVAAGADSPAAAAEIYLISRTIINMDNDQERSYMEQLAKELGLAPDLVAQLESHIKA
ncbi:MAG: tellurite resistance TerB family protein [Methylococcaceae bacterium]|nr:tellurite resistance TerB family protein [Methylococcaceae bacterium]